MARHAGMSKKRAREAEQERATAREGVRHRQREWLRRGSSATHARQGWRPRKVPRRAAARWLANVDNQVIRGFLVSRLRSAIKTNVGIYVWDSLAGVFLLLGKVRKLFGIKGLVDLKAPTKQEGEEADRLVPLEWMHATVAMDMGSDGVAAIHFAQRFLGLNIEPIHDASHGAWNDFKRGLRECNMMPFYYLFLVVVNTPHGPFLEDSRYNSLREALAESSKAFNARDSPLFVEHARNICVENGLEDELGSEEKLQRVFARLLEDPAIANKGYKCTMNRFFHGVERARWLVEHWSKWLYFMSYMALESDCLTCTHLKKLEFKEEAGEATAAQRMSAEEKALRGGQINAVAATVVFMSDRFRYHKLKAVIAAQAPVEAWHREQSHMCRSVDENSAWFRAQLAGGYMAHVEQIVARCLACLGSKRRCAFECKCVWV